MVKDCLVQHTRLPPGVNVCTDMHIHTYIDASGLRVEYNSTKAHSEVVYL
jgi:hypothetical protein